MVWDMALSPCGAPTRPVIHIHRAFHILCVCYYTLRMQQVRSRRELYSEATRAALLDEATRLFATRGYAGTSLEDVAAASQVTRGAVYHHFDGKQALFEAVLDAQETRAIARHHRRRHRRRPPGRGAPGARRVPRPVLRPGLRPPGLAGRADRARLAPLAGMRAEVRLRPGRALHHRPGRRRLPGRPGAGQPGQVLLLDARRRRARPRRGARSRPAPPARGMALPDPPDHLRPPRRLAPWPARADTGRSSGSDPTPPAGNAMKPCFQCVRTPWKSAFMAS